nr:F-box/kelch-repeat protein At5g60570-like [Tanacetum cinerariifolium]
MSRSLFTRIVHKITDNSPYFQQSSDCSRRVCISPLMKCTFTIRQLAYDANPEALDEYMQIGEKNSRDALQAFCKDIMDLYVDKFLRRPTYIDVEKLYAYQEEKHGIPVILRIINCTGCSLAQCPNAYCAQHCIGGHGGWEAFDPISKKWMRLPKIPCDECFNHADKESLAVGSELLVFGRELFEFAIWKYSLINRIWAKCDGMNYPRCLFGSGSLGSIAIVAGGTDQNGNVLKSAELYDSSTGKWEVLPNMHTPRRLCSGFFMDGKFYVIGGMLNPNDSLTCGEEFDLKTRIWRKIDGMYPYINRAAQAPPLVAVVANELYAVEYLSNMVMKYDKEKNTWDVLGRLPVRADSSNGWGLAFRACGEELLVVGGQRGPEGEAIVLSSWNPKSGVKNGILDWKVLGVKEHAGVFVYNCAVMGS